MAKRLRKEEQIMPDIRILTEGDSSVLVEFGKEISPEINRKITATVQLMKEQHIEGVVDMIPAFCSLLVNYDPRVISYDDLKKRLEILLKMEVTAGEGCRKVYEIPVCYGGEYGPDIENIAEHAGLSVEEVIKIHSSRDYLIYMLGFLPGFCYLGGLDERIHTPRLANPRIKINAGQPLCQVHERLPSQSWNHTLTESCSLYKGQYPPGLRCLPEDAYAVLLRDLA